MSYDELHQYFDELISKQDRERHEKRKRADTEMCKAIAEMTIPEFNAIWKNTGHPPGTVVTPEQKELDSYNQIYGRSVGVGMYYGTYLFWRGEFEKTGSAFAKERMLEAYKHGDEEDWEAHLKMVRKIKPPREHAVLKQLLASGIILGVLAILGSAIYVFPPTAVIVGIPVLGTLLFLYLLGR